MVTAPQVSTTPPGSQNKTSKFIFLKGVGKKRIFFVSIHVFCLLFFWGSSKLLFHFCGRNQKIKVTKIQAMNFEACFWVPGGVVAKVLAGRICQRCNHTRFAWLLLVRRAGLIGPGPQPPGCATSNYTRYAA